jgi:hypothetical protein
MKVQRFFWKIQQPPSDVRFCSVFQIAFDQTCKVFPIGRPYQDAKSLHGGAANPCKEKNGLQPVTAAHFLFTFETKVHV